MSITERLGRIYRSYRSLPGWVQIWVFFILGPVNLAAFALTATPIGYWAAVAVTLVFGLNGVIMFLNAGFSKALALPHIVFWTLLEIYAVWRLWLADGVTISEAEYIYGVILVVVNAISLVFDFYDTAEWAKGKREIAGFPDEPVVI